MIRVRNYEQLIIHLSQVSVWGWCYLGLAFCVSMLLGLPSENLVVNVLKKQAKKRVNYSWMIVPYRITASVIIFLVMTSFLGFFCSGDDDIEYFFVISVFGIVIFIIYMILTICRRRCILLYNNELYISKSTLFGVYNKIELDTDSVKIERKNNRRNNEIISFISTQGHKIEINTEELSQDDIDNIHDFLQKSNM